MDDRAHTPAEGAPALTIGVADYNDAADAACVVALLDAYASDRMGGGTPLALSVKARLVPALAARTGTFSVLARRGTEAVGLVNCFEGFSTFAARPLINIHDVYVVPGFRGQGLAKRMLAEVEAVARARGCCALTLEVLEGNRSARASYHGLGFSNAGPEPALGGHLFMKKYL